MIRCCIILLIIFFSYSHISAQIPFEHLKTEVEIKLVLDITRTENGYVWIATNGLGLIRHNSYSGNIYKYNKSDSSAISNNFVICLLEDSDTTLWVGTRNGLNRYIHETESFKSYYSNEYDSLSLSSNIISSIYQDSRRRLWIVSGKGINLYDKKKDNFKRFVQITTEDELFEYTDIVEDTNGQLWITTSYNGVYNFIPENNELIYYNDKSNTHNTVSVKKIYVDSRNNIWIGSRSSGLCLFDPVKGTFNYFPTQDTKYGTNGNIVYDILQEDEEHLLVAVDQGGINRYNYNTKSFEFITTHNNNAGNLTSDGIYSFHIDKEDILWVGTSRGGVNYYNPKKDRFKTFRRKRDEISSSLCYNIVSCFFEDSEGKIWIGSDGGGFSIFDPTNNTFKNYRHEPGNPQSLSSNVVRSFHEDENGDIWITTFNRGVNKFIRKTKTIERIDLDPSYYKPNETLQNILIDKKGRRWVQFPYGTIVLTDKNFIEITRFFKESSKQTVTRPYIVEMADGSIYVMTTEGVYLFSEQDLELNLIIDEVENNALYKDKNGLLYLGTIHKGVIVFDRKCNYIKTYNESNGLANNSISYIIDGNDGNIWVSTMNGLSCIEPGNDEITNYFELDGLQGNTFFIYSGFKSKDGTLYFGGTNGFSSFNPKNISINSLSPQVYIDEFYLSNKKVSAKDKNSPLKFEIHSSDEIVLNYKQNVLSFGFTAINFTYPLKNQYKYKLEGFDDNWISTTALYRTATYTNIDPGEYTFRVKATNNDHIPAREEAQVKIIIKPPFWRTIWFYTLLAIAALSMIYLIFILREKKLIYDKRILKIKVEERTKLISNQHALLNDQNQQLQEQKEELQKHRDELELMVEKRTKDLADALKKVEKSDRLKTSFLTNMSHEIRTPMNAIVGFSNLLLDKNYSNVEKEDFVSLIINNSNALLHLIEDLLELSLIETEQLAIKAQPFKINTFLNNIYSSYLHHKENSDIDIILHNDVEAWNYSLNSDESRIRQVITNLINNALKFTSEGYIKIGVEKEDDKVVFYVKDTGIGIKETDLAIIFNQFVKFDTDKSNFTRGLGLGLSISKRISNLLNGDLSVTSKMGSGSEFRLSLPKSLLVNDTVEKRYLRKNNLSENWEQKTFLIVEDESANYRFLYELLHRTKAKIIWAQDGLEAVNIFTDTSNIDAVLLDIKLPVMDGYETLKWIRKNKPGQIVIAQTAYAYKGDVERMEEAGFTDYLTKPINPSQLFNKIRKYV